MSGAGLQPTIKCDGCGVDSRQTEKPWNWYKRTDKDGTQTACSRNCIDIIAANTGKTRVILPW